MIHRHFISSLVGVAVLGLAVVPAPAALTWTQTEVTSATKPLQKVLAVTFGFKNTGQTPVTIRDVQVNCDCMTAAADKTVYQPGESGTISAHFTVGDRIGSYERGVKVLTDDGAKPQHLRVHIEVPELAAIEPRILDWESGAPADEKPVLITVAAGIQINFSELFVSAPSFSARVETIEAGRRYRLFVKPLATAEAASAAIRFKGKAESGDDVVVSAYANVH